MWHFAAGAYASEKLGSERALSRGRNKEEGDTWSSYSYEDLPSNLLGAFFEEFMGFGENRGQSIVGLVQNYLIQLHFVEHPMEFAPNADKITGFAELKKGGYSESDIALNYEPKFTRLSLVKENSLDQKLKAFKEIHAKELQAAAEEGWH